jgi:hypothetical protein
MQLGVAHAQELAPLRLQVCRLVPSNRRFQGAYCLIGTDYWPSSIFSLMSDDLCPSGVAHFRTAEV